MTLNQVIANMNNDGVNAFRYSVNGTNVLKDSVIIGHINQTTIDDKNHIEVTFTNGGKHSAIMEGAGTGKTLLKG